MSTGLTPTRGQVERTLAQRIQALYREYLGHQPSKVTCQLSDQNLVILLENAITQPEQLLTQTGRQELAKQVHSDLGNVIQPKIKELVEEILQVSVLDLLSDTTLETGLSGFIVLLTATPNIRSNTSSSKIRKKNSYNKSEGQNS